MLKTIDKVVDRLLHKRALGRWTRMADIAASMDIEGLRSARTRARAMRRALDRVILEADNRLALPVVGSSKTATAPLLSATPRFAKAEMNSRSAAR